VAAGPAAPAAEALRQLTEEAAARATRVLAGTKEVAKAARLQRKASEAGEPPRWKHGKREQVIRAAPPAARWSVSEALAERKRLAATGAGTALPALQSPRPTAAGGHQIGETARRVVYAAKEHYKACGVDVLVTTQHSWSHSWTSSSHASVEYRRPPQSYTARPPAGRASPSRRARGISDVDH
jgi:hypothetical protein